MKNSMEAALEKKNNNKLNTKLTYDPANPLLGIYSEKNIIQKGSCTPLFTEALFTIAKTLKQPKCLWTGMDKNVAHTQWNITQALKRMK